MFVFLFCFVKFKKNEMLSLKSVNTHVSFLNLLVEQCLLCSLCVCVKLFFFLFFNFRFKLFCVYLLWVLNLSQLLCCCLNCFLFCQFITCHFILWIWSCVCVCFTFIHLVSQFCSVYIFISLFTLSISMLGYLFVVLVFHISLARRLHVKLKLHFLIN